MASYIVDKMIEKQEAYWATILDLEIKKYLNKNDLTNSGIKDETQSLYFHEQYVLECLKKGMKIDLSKFEKLVIKDCKDAKLVISVDTLGQKIYTSMVYLYVIGFVFLSIIRILGIKFINMSEDVEIWYSFIYYMLFPICLAVGSYFVTTEERTSKGYDFAIQMMGLKSYIRDYSLLKEKDLDYIVLTDRYIPYAIALGEADKIEEKYFIKIKYFN